MILVKEILKSSSYFVLNKEIVRKYGANCALLLSTLSEAESMFQEEDGWFFQTIETIEEVTGLSRKTQALCIKSLLEDGIIEQKNVGLPRRRFFKINYEKVYKLVWPKGTVQYVPNGHTGMSERDNNKESINKEHNKENNNKREISQNEKIENERADNNDTIDASSSSLENKPGAAAAGEFSSTRGFNWKNIKLRMPEDIELTDDQKRERIKLILEATVSDRRWCEHVAMTRKKVVEWVHKRFEDFCIKVLYEQDYVYEHSLMTAKSHFINILNKEGKT